MNENQKRALIALAAVILLMLVYPPYVIHGYAVNASAVVDSGYAFIFSLPDRASVNVLTLIAQWVGMSLTGAIAFIVLKDKA